MSDISSSDEEHFRRSAGRHSIALVRPAVYAHKSLRSCLSRSTCSRISRHHELWLYRISAQSTLLPSSAATINPRFACRNGREPCHQPPNDSPARLKRPHPSCIHHSRRQRRLQKNDTMERISFTSKGKTPRIEFTGSDAMELDRSGRSDKDCAV